MNGMLGFGRNAMLTTMAVIGAPKLAHAHVGVGPVHDTLHALERPLAGIACLSAVLVVAIWAARRRRVARRRTT
jgi:hydrogenase/urease accessory protein HupE